MFCEKCGTKNDDNAKFCEKCGAAIEVFEAVYAGSGGESGTFENKDNGGFVAPNAGYDGDFDMGYESGGYKAPKKSMSLKNKILLVLVGAVVVCGSSLYYIGKLATSPEKIVEKYFENVSSKRYAEAYECMDIDGNEFTTKDMFVKVMENKNKDDNTEILNFTVKEQFEQNPLTKRYIVTYTQKGSKNTSSEEITLMKHSKKKWLFYDDYRIAQDGLVAVNYSVVIPEGAEIYIDDIKVDEKYAEKNLNENDLYGVAEKSYTIPSIFSGMHRIKVTAPFANDKEFEDYIENGESTEVYNLEVNEQTKTELSKLAEEFTQKFVASAVEKKSFDELKSYFSDKTALDNIQDIYDNLTEKGVNDEGVGVKSITFGKFKPTASKKYETESKYSVPISFEYNYTALRKDWFDESIEEYTPERMQNGSGTVYFMYEDGKWNISELYINIYLYY